MRFSLQRSFHWWTAAWLLLLPANLVAGKVEEYAAKIAPLIDHRKLATLGPRGANPRIQKTVYWLAVARRDGASPQDVLVTALSSIGETNKQRADLTKSALIRNLAIAEHLGCLSQVGMEEMRHGKSPTVERGPYKGQELSVDHIIARAVVPELDNVIANLELLPLRLNQNKNSSIGQRQRALAEQFYRAGMLSARRLGQIDKLAAREPFRRD